MGSIVLIATGHKENGLCNSDELFKIIEQVAPEVIFEEISPASFHAVYEGTRKDSLETAAIKRYMGKHPIIHLPVDLEVDLPTMHYFKREMFEKLYPLIEYHNPMYRYFTNVQVATAERGGFPYLNGDSCSSLLARIRSLEEEMLKKFDNPALSEVYRNWLSIIDRRENEMLKNIYSYGKQNAFERALFLTGAEHRTSIMDKIPRFEQIAQQQIRWIFDYLKPDRQPVL